MDYSLPALVAVIAIAVLIAYTHQGRPDGVNAYQRVIGTAVLGLLLLVSGIIGLDVSRMRGLFQGVRWVDGPVWWQVGLGVSLVSLAGYLAQRMPSRPVVTRR